MRQARFSTRWELVNGVRAQAVQVTVANMLPAFTLSPETSIHSEVLVSIEGEGIETISSGSIYRLVPSDQARVDVFVTGSKSGGLATVRLRDSHGNDLGSSEGWTTAPLITEWTPDADVLKMHETPSWVNQGFIHRSWKFLIRIAYSGMVPSSVSCKDAIVYIQPSLIVLAAYIGVFIATLHGWVSFIDDLTVFIMCF